MAEAIHAGLSGTSDLDQAVRGYQDRRDARWLGHWNFAVWLASMEPPTAEFIALLQALTKRPQAARRFFAFFEGQEPELNFMAPDNLARIMTSAPEV